MNDGRSTGFILMALAVAAFLGSTSEMLPPETFFPALALFVMGAFQFMRSNRTATEAAERRIEQKLHPTIREDRSALTLAERQARRRGAALSALNPDPAPAMPSAIPASSSRPGPRSPVDARSTATRPVQLEHALELEATAGELDISSDVSFPIELQRGEQLADQLQKLNQLLVQGILSEEEFAIAKAKLLG